jgi:cysteine desulfurase
MGDSKLIYLDYAASTPCDPEVVRAMLPYLTENFSNPGSAHRQALAADRAIQEARLQLAEAISCDPGELVFTSGATESNNLAILGLLGDLNEPGRRKLITTQIEHKSVLEPARFLQASGCKVEFCPVDDCGRIDLGELSDLLDDQTALVTVQLANNEIGTIQPLAEIVQLARRVGALVHSDCSQALGKLPIDVESLDVDMLSFSAHKLCGPKGSGALFLRSGSAKGAVSARSLGGGQERGYRSGTPNVPAIVGFGEAARIATLSQTDESHRVEVLRDRLEARLGELLPDMRINGDLTRRLPGISSVTIPGVEAEAVIARLPQIAMSSSSACTERAPEPSHVLTSIGLSRKEAYSSLRLSAGRFTLASEVDLAAEFLAETASEIRSQAGGA